jgi:2-polyprenyl-6-methoxyphenol hydroxylase-like FAD-dependent oxidoreductase
MAALRVREGARVSERALVVGGSVAGLASALALARAGLRVLVLEKDAEPLPASSGEAFASWQRHGVPQARHSHAFLARLLELLKLREPALLDALRAHGAEEIRFVDVLKKALPGQAGRHPSADAQRGAAERGPAARARAISEREGLAEIALLPEDDAIAVLACRRTTFEWTLRRHVESLPEVEIRSGIAVTGLLAEPAANGAPPRVCGASAGEQRFEADLVVDASGRRSRLRHWLAAIGARRPREHSEPCGIFYSSRFYHARTGSPLPSLDGPMGADYGFLKVGVFPGDARSWSVTLAASPDDPPLRALTRPGAFEALAAALPLTAPWVDPAVAEAQGDVHAMTGLRNTRRFLVEDGEPLALGVAAVGDALIHTNPIVGRGCTLAFVNAYLLADAWRESAGALREFALALETAVAREIVPWYEGMLAQDRDAIRVMQMLRDGEDPWRVNRDDGSVDPAAWLRVLLRDGFVPALREDAAVLRTFLRLFNLLDAPSDLMKDPALLSRVLASYARRETRVDPPQPTRAEVVARLAALA